MVSGRTCETVSRGEKLTLMLSVNIIALNVIRHLSGLEQCTWNIVLGGPLSKAKNQAVTSNSMPNADPSNMDLRRAKHPEPAHSDRDPISLSSILCPEPQTLAEYWSSDAGAEFLEKRSVSLKYVSISAPLTSDYVRY